MSPWNAPATWPSTVPTLAFHPKRPSISSPVWGSGTRLIRPEMPSPSASSGSAAARTEASGIASSNPTPITCGASRGEIITSSPNGPWAKSEVSIFGRRSS